MTSAQKIIKYVAIAFAIFLVVAIITGGLNLLYALSGMLGLKNNNETQIGEMSTINIENNDIKQLQMNIKNANVIIKRGDLLKFETNDKNIICFKENENLKIEDKNNNWFTKNENSSLILYLPENIEFENVNINAGAGQIYIENLNTNKVSFELGAGETKIENLNISKECDIECGAGKVDILSGKINDLDLEIGVGEINFSGTITGNSNINAGIGSANIELQDSKESYKIKVDKGIGSVKIDGKETWNEETLGNGANNIQINGGIGSINIDFKDKTF